MALNHEKIVVLFGLQYHLKVNKYFSGITYTKRRFNYKVFNEVRDGQREKTDKSSRF